MGRVHFLVYRPLQFVPLLFGITLVSFLLIHLAPGSDLARLYAGNAATPDQLAALRAQYGFGHVLPLQYLFFLANLLRGELGQSAVYQAPVFSVVIDHAGPTFFLILYGALLAVTMAVALAMLAASHEGSTVDRLIRAGAAFGLGMPALWLGIVLIFIFSAKLGWFPDSGFGGNALSRLHHLFLPALTIALALAPLLVRSLRASMVKGMEADHVTAARSRGLPELTIFRHHVILNALIPTVSLLGANIGWLVGSTVIVERVFAIPGLGSLVIGSILAHDYLVVQAAALVFAVFIIVAKYAFDVATAAVDPRVKP